MPNGYQSIFSAQPLFITIFVCLLMVTACQKGTAPTILYLARDEAGKLQLFQQVIGANSASQLSQEETGILDYALSPNGRFIAYATPADKDHTNIWLINVNSGSSKLVYSCRQASCTQLLWAPDNQRLIYEKRAIDENDGVASSPTVWWLDTLTQESVPVLIDTTHPSMAASISHNGEWVAYAVPSQERQYLYHFENNESFFVQSALGTTAVWHPDDQKMLINDLDLVVLHGEADSDHQDHSHEYAEAVHLFVVDINTEEREKLTTAPNVDDGVPVYSPDGKWILFGRKPIRTSNGRQLWLMREDGSELRPLTDNLAIHYGGASWSEDGQFILYQAFNTKEPAKIPDIFIMNVQSGETTQIASGFLPRWLSN